MRPQDKERIQVEVVSRVVEGTVRRARRRPEGYLEGVVNDTLYHERLRLDREDSNQPRIKEDLGFYGPMRKRLTHASSAARQAMVEAMARHFVEEVTGNFDRRVYNVATRAIPTGLSALLNAMSPGRLMNLRDLRSSNQTFLRDFDALAVNGKKLHEDVKAKLPPSVGFFFSLLLILWLGSLASGFLGRQVIGGIDRSMKAIPLVRSIYPYTKQVVEFFLSEEQLEFDTVVAVPYPGEHLWALGFVTSKAFRSLREASGQDLVSVFIPSSPMPMTGYTVFAPVDRLIPMPITVDEALRATVSGGVLIPPREMVPGRAEVGLDAQPAPREPE